MRFLILLVALTLFSSNIFAQQEPPPDFLRFMNLGKAYLENREFQKAIDAYQQAIKRNARSAPAMRNLARALLLAQKPSDATNPLSRAMQLEPDHPGSSYLSGLMHIQLSQFEQAIPHLEKAARLDPQIAAIRYQLASAYQTMQHDEKAKAQLLEVIRLDPLHGSAQFKLGTYARREGNRAEFQLRTKEFIRLRKLFPDETRSVQSLQKCIHTLPESVSLKDLRERAKAEPALDVTFTDVTSQSFTNDQDRSATAIAVIDVDEYGNYTYFVADRDGLFAFISVSPDGTFRRESINIQIKGAATINYVLVGNFHDDVPEGEKYDHNIHALNDVLLVDPNEIYLLKRTGKKTFRDITPDAGLSNITANHVQWIDYDHDGDLDIVFARNSGVELWQNNGDATFSHVTEKIGLNKTANALFVKPVDLDRNVAVDLIVAHGNTPTLIFENQRAGQFAPQPEPPGPLPAANRILADDLNQDGNPDTILFADQQATILMGKSSDRLKLDLSKMNVSSAIIFDYDNDARLDICAVGKNSDQPDRGVLRIWRGTPTNHSAPDQWLDVSDKIKVNTLQLPPIKDVLSADFDSDGDSDLILICNDDQIHVLRNDGGHDHGQLKLRLSTIKSNPSGFGTHIELRRRYFYTSRTINHLPIEIGLRGIKTCESLQTIWTNGVVDNLINPILSIEKPITIIEKNVATGSCPFLYAWDGKKFRFVTDILGNAPIGLPLSRDVILQADPSEIVLIGDSNKFPPIKDHYTVKLTSEFLEVLYLDHAKLIAVDHPGHIEIHPTDKLMPAPFPASELWALRSYQTLIRAIGDDNIDRTQAVKEWDGLFAQSGKLLPPPFRGMCYPLTLTLDFGPLDHTRPLVLALTGWLNYGQASTNIALSQSRAHEIIPPKLEIETIDGQWHPVDLVVGMPAGKTKTILCDLKNKLPAGAKRLRLINTFEIHWDRIRLMERIDLPEEAMHELSPSSADLQWRGFSQMKSRAPLHPTTPDFNIVYDLPPWRGVLEGWCTRYGDVLELVRQHDDQLILANAGDVVTLEFKAADLPPPPQDLQRTFFFYSFGWEKDGDHNVTRGDTVGPLPTDDPNTPITQEIDRSDWRIRYNTRWVPKNRFEPDN